MAKADIQNALFEKDFYYAYSPHTLEKKAFAPAEKRSFTDGEYFCLDNKFNENINGFDYISLLSRKKYTAGTKVRIKCAFKGYGAPLIVFTDDITDEGDFVRYGLHFEAVIHKGGVNMWHIIPFPENTARPIKSTNILSARFPLTENTLIEMTLCFGKKTVTVMTCGKSFEVSNEDFPESFHVGFTACEGYCAFTEFDTEEPQ